MMGFVQTGIETGGLALVFLALFLWAAWALAFLESICLWSSFPKLRSFFRDEWSLAQERSLSAKESSAIRSGLLSKMRQALFGRLGYLRLIVVLSPLCGLLGTVAGMIEVFEVVQLFGTSNVQALATGISKATFSTAAGIVVSLIALALFIYLSRAAESSFQQFRADLEA